MKALLLTLPLLLAACAPTQTGSRAVTPQVMASGASPVMLRPGQTVYVQYTYPRDVIKVNDQHFKDLKIDFDNVGGQNVRSVEAYAGWLALKSAALPRGVTLSLSSASLVKEIVETTNTDRATQVRYYERVRVILKASAGADAPAVDDLFALTYSDGVDSSEVTLRVVVEPGGDRVAAAR